MFQPLRIVFMGTPEFAVPMLDTLYHSQHQIAGVITAPDKPAVANNLHILQPEKLKNDAFLNELRALSADIFVVVAFRMLPEVVWNMPPLGTVNLHASLLPNYRGAAPINWAIINGEKETGVTTFKLQQEIDTGQIILREKVAIRDDETVGELYEELMNIGKSVLLETIDAIASSHYPLLAQDHITHIKHAPKIFKETCRIDWAKDAAAIYDLIRGLSPYPAAWTTLQGKTLKIYRSEKHIHPHARQPGETETDGKTYFRFYCANGYIAVKELQLEGKKKMSVEEFLRGYKG
jgi:methionyl-tRNA formyltransferase